MFQLWLYTVSHGQMLFRSTKSRLHNSRIDLFFKNVKLIDVPVFINSVVIDEVARCELSSDKTGGIPFHAADRFFLIRAKERNGLVVAGFFDWIEDDGEHYEDSKFMDE
jgi:hypothetical protein